MFRQRLEVGRWCYFWGGGEVGGRGWGRGHGMLVFFWEGVEEVRESSEDVRVLG